LSSRLWTELSALRFPPCLNLVSRSFLFAFDNGSAASSSATNSQSSAAVSATATELFQNAVVGKWSGR
jgi:hypothetical protein